MAKNTADRISDVMCSGEPEEDTATDLLCDVVNEGEMLTAEHTIACAQVYATLAVQAQLERIAEVLCSR